MILRARYQAEDHETMPMDEIGDLIMDETKVQINTVHTRRERLHEFGVCIGTLIYLMYAPRVLARLEFLWDYEGVLLMFDLG